MNGKDLGFIARPRSQGALLLCLLLPFLVAWGHPHVHPAHEHRVIEGLEQDWRQAVLSGDVSAIDRLLADDYIGIEPNGMVQTKAQTLEGWRAHEVELTTLDLSEVHVRTYGGTAVVTSRARVVGHSRMGLMDGEYRYTRVYHLESPGQWRIVSFEANRISDPRARQK